MSRYVNLTEIQNHLDIDTLNDTDFPKQAQVERWIKSAENEVDKLTKSRWDLRKVENELISPDSQTTDFVLAHRPVSKVFTLEKNTGDEWSESWSEIDEDDYRILNSAAGFIRTKEYFWLEESLRCTYEAGYEDIPTWIVDLTLLLVEKRYLMNQMGIAAADTETVSVAVIRISNKADSSLKYKVEALDKEIQHQLRFLKNMKAKNMRMVPYTKLSPNKRYRGFW